MDGFIKPEPAFNFGDHFRVQALGTSIGAFFFHVNLCEFCFAARDLFHHTGIHALQFGNQLIHRAAWSHLDDKKIDGDNGNQGRNDQQQSANDI